MFRSTLLIVSLLAASVAVAQKAHFGATLAQPVEGTKDVVANGNLWRCFGANCTLVSEPKNANAIASCRILRKKVGTLSAYGDAVNAFDADKLNKCNTDE